MYLAGLMSSVAPVSFLKHPNYNASNLDNDVGLVTLATDLAWSKSVGPVCLPDQPLQDNRQCSVFLGSAVGLL